MRGGQVVEPELWKTLVLTSLAAAACGSESESELASRNPAPPPVAPTAPPPEIARVDVRGCDYPSGFGASPSVGRPMPPFVWTTAMDMKGRARNLDLAAVHCNSDDEVDWSPFERLLFITWPGG